MVRLRGEGHDGVGEDVVYDVLDHIAHRDAGPVLDLSGPSTFGELCELLGELDLFVGAPPVRDDTSRLYRRWAYESAALDLALRQNGISLHEALAIEPKPVRFVCSTRLGELRRRRSRLDHRAASKAPRQAPRAALQARPRERLGRRR